MTTTRRPPRGGSAPSGPGRRGAARGSLRAAVATTHAEADRLAPAWRALWEASGDPNPFLQPEWLLSWARLHVPDGALHLATLHAGDALVALAPMHVRRRAGARALLPLGCGPGHELTEVPGIVMADDRRRLLPALVRAIADGAGAWDWVRLTLAPGDGWLEPGWLPAAGRPAGILHHQTRACVVMPLAASWEEQRGGFGRNLRESLRRSRNRLDRSGADWSVRTVVRGPGWAAAVASLCRLHARRAVVEGRPRHMDWSADPAVARHILDAGARLPAGAIEVMSLEVGGVPVAAQAVLRGGGTAYLLMSGFDPRWWWHGPMTELVGAAVRAAIARGDRRLNLSSGPIASKTRWSRELELHQDFVLVGARGRSRAVYAGYASLDAVHRYRRESRRNRPTGPAPAG